MKKKRIAFWKYDLFPYILWGTIDHRQKREDGLVYVTEYQGHVRPLFILNGITAAVFIEKLQTLKNTRATTLNEIERLYEAERQRLMDEYNPPKA